MMTILIFLIIYATLSSGLPTDDRKSLPEKVDDIAASDTEDISTAETFYSGYNNFGYPSGVGVGVVPPRGGYGWKGSYKPVAGPIYGTGFELGYAGIPVSGYGSYGPVPVVATGVPVVATGGGFGWRQGVNRWAS